MTDDIEVALDLTPALSGLTGVARYSRELAARLPAAGVRVRGFAVGRGPGQLPPSCRHLKAPLRVVQPVWRAVGRPRAERLAGGGDVVHSIDLMPPPTGKPLVVTVHDLAALQRPDLHSARAQAAARERLDSLGRASAVIAVSETTADAMVEFGVARDAITVVLEAAAALPAPKPVPDLPSPYLLAVGEITTRKDYPTMIRALAATEKTVRLAVVGPTGFRAAEVFALAESLGVADRVTFLGHVSDETLAGLYAGATALCLTSVIEGFGIPMVEAMAGGLPIIASDIAIVREVAADAAVLAPVGDAAAFADQMTRVSRDETLRQTLGAAGRRRAPTFSWERAAAGTAAVYRQALSCG